MIILSVLLAAILVVAAIVAIVMALVCGSLLMVFGDIIVAIVIIWAIVRLIKFIKSKKK